MCVCVPGMWGPTGGGRKPGQEEGWPGSSFFSLMSEVARWGGLSKVVKSICSGEGGKEKRLVASGKEHKGKIVHRERCSLGLGVARLV